MSMTEPAYFTAFKNLAFSRTPSGVLTLRLHAGDEPATFTGQMHPDIPRALYEIGKARTQDSFTAQQAERWVLSPRWFPSSRCCRGRRSWPLGRSC